MSVACAANGTIFLGAGDGFGLYLPIRGLPNTVDSLECAKRSINVSLSVLQRIADGDRSAVQECIRSYGGLVWSLCRRMLWNNEDAEDAAQEIFLDLWKNAARFDPALASETTFVAMIARRRLIDRIRSSKRRPIADSIDEMNSELSTRADKVMETSIEAREAAKALDQLKPEQRNVLRLSIVNGMSHQEISDATGIPLGTVKTHCRRGLIQVREILGVEIAVSKQEASL